MRIMMLALALVASPALASDLEGTWEGKLTCTAIDTISGEKNGGTSAAVLEISEVETVGNSMRLNVEINDAWSFSARAIDRGGVGSGKGVGAFVRCGSNDSIGTGTTEIEHFTFKVNASNGKGSIKSRGATIRTLGVGASFIATCKGSWKRVSTEDPAVPACPD